MRYAIAILGLLVLVATLAGVKGAQISSLMAFGKEAAKAGPPPEAVSTAQSQEQAWEGRLDAVGSVAADKGVTVSNEAAGVVTAIHFESGQVVEQGRLLVELDTSVERAQLASARARRSLAAVSLERSRALVKSGSLAKADLDADQSAFDTATADANALSAQIGRKSVRAPFSGRLGIRAVNLGQYLAPGTPVTVLESTESVFVDFTLPQQELPRLETGFPIHVTLASGDAFDGNIRAIDPSVDVATRSVKVRASVPNQQHHLRPGMFVNVSVVLPQRAKVVVVPQTALVHAPYGDSVFIVEEDKNAGGKPTKIVRQQFVRTGEPRGDFVTIAEGVQPGQEVVTAGAFKLRNGARVIVTKDVKPAPDLTPHPPNR
jgi:membrane fusion protein (multidrug efflux system)